MKEYRIINHSMEDLSDEVNGMAKRGWIMFKAFDPTSYNKSEGMMMRIIWEREGKELPTTVKDK